MVHAQSEEKAEEKKEKKRKEKITLKIVRKKPVIGAISTFCFPVNPTVATFVFLPEISNNPYQRNPENRQPISANQQEKDPKPEKDCCLSFWVL